jgi:hypothetical protein
MRKLERAKGFEPSTPTLARLCSTPELHPHPILPGEAGLGGRSMPQTGAGCNRVSHGKRREMESQGKWKAKGKGEAWVERGRPPGLKSALKARATRLRMSDACHA